LKAYASFDDVLPNRTMKIGQSWQKNKEIAGIQFGRLNVHMTYTFQNWGLRGDHQCAHLESLGTFVTKTPSAASGVLLDIKDGKSTGDFWYDPALGIIV